MSVFLAPTFGVGYQGMTLSGALLSGGQIYTYQAGSSTLQPTYTTSAGTVQNANPIILDASGKPPSEVWLTQGQAYKFVVMDSLSNVIATYDNVSGINDVVFTSTFSEWVATGLTPTYISPTQFTVPGNQTTILQVNRRVQITCTAGVIYGYISVSVYTSLTTVTVVMDSTPLDSGISIVNVAFLSGTNPSIPMGYRFYGNVTGNVTGNVIGGSFNSGFTTVNSATTPDIFGAASNTINYTNALNATGFASSPQAGVNRTLICSGACSFTAGANLLIEGINSGNTITLGANAIVNVIALTTTRFKITYSYSGSFVATTDGFSTATAPTPTINFTVNNGIANIYIPYHSLSGSGGAGANTGLSITNIPTSLSPASAQMSTNLIGDNSGTVISNINAGVNGTTMTFYISLVNNNWTNASTKGISSTTITYPLN